MIRVHRQFDGEVAFINPLNVLLVQPSKDNKEATRIVLSDEVVIDVMGDAMEIATDMAKWLDEAFQGERLRGLM